MNKKLLNIPISIIFPFFLNAQSSIQNSQSQLAISGIPTVNLPSGKVAIVETPVQARRQLLKNLKGLQVLNGDMSFDNLDFNNADAYKEYIILTKETLDRKLREIETDENQLDDIQKLKQSLQLLSAASCLEEQRNDRIYVRQKDLDGNEIVAFPLDSLRSNARYGLVEAYKEGFSRIKKDQVYGFINLCGDEIVPCQYQTADVFNNGKALVKKVVWYFVDGENNESDELTKVIDAKALTQGVSLVKFKEGKWALIDNKYDVSKKTISGLYDEIVPFFNKETFKVKLGSQYGIINLKGQVLLTPSYEFIEPTGIASLFKVGQSGKVGLVDTQWKIKFEAIYKQISEFDANGIAWAQIDGGYSLLSSKTFKNSKTYKTISPFSPLGMAQIQATNNTLGLININLDVIFDPKYGSIADFNEFKLAAVSYPNRKFGFINTKGEEIITPSFDEVGKFNKFGLVVVREDNRDARNKVYKTSEVYNRFGQAVVTKSNDTLGVASNLSINYDFVDTMLNGKYILASKLIDNDFAGYHLIEAASFRLVTKVPYDEITEFDEFALFRYKSGKHWGMMDTTGKVILQPTYLEIRKPGEGYYAAMNDDGKYGFIDKKAKIQIPCEYPEVKIFKKGHCVVSKGKEKWGLINKFNAKVVPCSFKMVNETDGRYEMIDEKNNKYMIDQKGDCMDGNCSKFEEIRRKANQSISK